MPTIMLSDLKNLFLSFYKKLEEEQNPPLYVNGKAFTSAQAMLAEPTHPYKLFLVGFEVLRRYVSEYGLDPLNIWIKTDAHIHFEPEFYTPIPISVLILREIATGLTKVLGKENPDLPWESWQQIDISQIIAADDDNELDVSLQSFKTSAHLNTDIRAKIEVTKEKQIIGEVTYDPKRPSHQYDFEVTFCQQKRIIIYDIDKMTEKSKTSEVALALTFKKLTKPHVEIYNWTLEKKSSDFIKDFLNDPKYKIQLDRIYTLMIRKYYRNEKNQDKKISEINESLKSLYLRSEKKEIEDVSKIIIPQPLIAKPEQNPVNEKLSIPINSSSSSCGGKQKNPHPAKNKIKNTLHKKNESDVDKMSEHDLKRVLAEIEKKQTPEDGNQYHITAKKKYNSLIQTHMNTLTFFQHDIIEDQNNQRISQSNDMYSIIMKMQDCHKTRSMFFEFNNFYREVIDKLIADEKKLLGKKPLSDDNFLKVHSGVILITANNNANDKIKAMQSFFIKVFMPLPEKIKVSNVSVLKDFHENVNPIEALKTLAKKINQYVLNRDDIYGNITKEHIETIKIHTLVALKELLSNAKNEEKIRDINTLYQLHHHSLLTQDIKNGITNKDLDTFLKTILTEIKIKDDYKDELLYNFLAESITLMQQDDEGSNSNIPLKSNETEKYEIILIKAIETFLLHHCDDVIVKNRAKLKIHEMEWFKSAIIELDGHKSKIFYLLLLLCVPFQTQINGQSIIAMRSPQSKQILSLIIKNQFPDVNEVNIVTQYIRRLRFMIKKMIANNPVEQLEFKKILTLASQFLDIFSQNYIAIKEDKFQFPGAVFDEVLQEYEQKNNQTNSKHIIVDAYTASVKPVSTQSKTTLTTQPPLQTYKQTG